MFAVDNNYLNTEYYYESNIKPSDASNSYYYKEVGRSPLLSKEEEEELGERISKGDQQAVNRLINSSLRLVISIAAKYAGKGLSMMDLIQEGNIGLIEAAKKFDGSLGYRFATYATWWIRQSILRAIYNGSRTIRLPIHIINIYRLYKQTLENYRKKYDKQPTLIEISRIIYPVSQEKIRRKLSKKYGRILASDDPLVRQAITEEEINAKNKLEAIIKIANEPLSFELSIGDGKFTLGDTIAAPENDNFLDKDEINRLLKSLTPEERKIIKLRFGLNNIKSQTLDMISRQLGVSKERVRQKEVKAIEKLQKAAGQIQKQIKR